ncbi:MAG TPA: VCBS repeat-containing protein [Fimbriiglobus sp.]|jgi:hypothetical protein
MFGSTRKTARPASKKLRTPLCVDALDSRDVPTVIAVGDIYTAHVGQVLTVPVNIGLLSNDFSQTNFGAVLVADLKTAPQITGVGPALPPNALTLSSNGAFQFLVPSSFNIANSPITFTYQARDTTNGDVATATVTIIVNGGNDTRYAVGSGVGIANQVNVVNPSNGLQVFSFSPFESTFTGGVRVATGDFNQDGVDDIVSVPGFGGSARVTITDGKTGATLGSFFAFEPTFTGGAYVAVGDVDGDFVPDIIVGAGDGGGPRVQVYSGANAFGLPPIADFFAYETTFRNGVRVAAGNLDGDDTGSGTGTYEIITGAGPGGGPAVKVFDAAGIFSGNPTPIAKQAFFAFDSNLRGGVNVAAGEFRGDGKADIIVGSGNGTPVVRVFDGRLGSLLREFTVPAEQAPTGATPPPSSSGLFSGPSGSLIPPTGIPGSLIGIGAGNRTGGVRVAAIDRNGDGLSDIITGAGIGNVDRVQIFDGNTLAQLDSELAFNGTFTGGVFVGGHASPETSP